MVGNRHVCIVAGEPSGDFLGGQLAKALNVQGVSLSGVGGAHMRAAGIESLFPYEDLAVMGIAEILPNLPTILRRIRETADFILKAKPDVVVTIDSPDFVFRVIRAVKAKTSAPPKFIHYVAPSVWAWRPKRAEKLARLVDGLICLFDFEPPYFEKHGLRSIAAGHPLVEGGAMEARGARFRDAQGITEGEPCIGVLFGSRKGELKRTGKIIRDAAYMVAERIGGNVHIIAPTLPHVRDSVFELLRDYDGPIHITDEPAQKWNAFAAMDVAIAVSGTVGLELAAMGRPHVIAYRASPLTAEIVRRVIRVPYVHLANIIEGREIVPEFLQEKCEAGAIADTAFQIFRRPDVQRMGLQTVAKRIGFGEEETPSQKAAAFVVSFL